MWEDRETGFTTNHKLQTKQNERERIKLEKVEGKKLFT